MWWNSQRVILTNSEDEENLNKKHISSEAENIKKDDQVSFNQAESKLGEIGEKIISAKVGSRVKQKPDKLIIIKNI